MDPVSPPMTRRTPPSPPLDRRWVLLVLLLGVLLTQLPAILGGGFRYDDGHHLVENPAVRSAVFGIPDDGSVPGVVAAIGEYFTDPQAFSGEPGNRMYRPVLMTVNGLTHAVWGFRASGWVLVNALLHALCAVLLWRLALRIGLGDWGAALCGACFAFHPTATETVAYVSSRSESVAALFVLAALHAHLSARERGGTGRVAWLGVSVVAGAAGVLSKETAAGLCAAVGAYELFATRGSWRERLVRGLGYGGVHALALVAVLSLRHAMLGAAVGGLGGDLTHVADPDPYSGGGRSVLGNLVVQARVVVLYLQLYLKPVSLSPDHVVPPFPEWTAPAISAAALHLAGVVGAVVAAWRGHRLVPLGVAWFWIFLAPSVALPLNVIMNEHRMYLPALAVALVAGAVLARVALVLGRRGVVPARAMATVCAPLVLFAVLTVQRSYEWTDLTLLWERATVRVPDSPRAHMNLGAGHFVAAKQLRGREALERVDQALDAYERSRELNPRSFHLALNMGNAWLLRARLTGESEDFRRAVSCYDHLGALVGEHTQRWRMAKAEALTWWGSLDPARLPEALAIIERLDAEDESETPLYDDMRARVERKQGLRDQARASMAAAIEADSGDASLHRRLALGWWAFEDALVARASDPRRAERLLSEAEQQLGAAQDIAKRGRQFLAPLYLARFLRVMGQEQQAEVFVQAAEDWGWAAPEHEIRWLAGLGRTPNVAVGTLGVPRPGSGCGTR